MWITLTTGLRTFFEDSRGRLDRSSSRLLARIHKTGLRREPRAQSPEVEPCAVRQTATAAGQPGSSANPASRVESRARRVRPEAKEGTDARELIRQIGDARQGLRRLRGRVVGLDRRGRRRLRLGGESGGDLAQRRLPHGDTAQIELLLLLRLLRLQLLQSLQLLLIQVQLLQLLLIQVLLQVRGQNTTSDVDPARPDRPVRASGHRHRRRGAREPG